ncbi:hypothetical protein EYF80_018990 [Liparis tanakae]|uniref:Uncharacterized protein n=1 Tax=Liparis tanakae TaxID=230148 RepID=A0A4Z2HYA7_9TELE|nr:hypothetical protein EYF80_018990 [Liparis tanakae]
MSLRPRSVAPPFLHSQTLHVALVGGLRGPGGPGGARSEVTVAARRFRGMRLVAGTMGGRGVRRVRALPLKSCPGSPVRYHLLRGQPVRHGDAPPLDVRSPLTGRRVGGALLADGQSEGGLQVAQRERPAHRTVDVDPAGLGDRFALADVKPHELLDRVEAVGLQHVLHLRRRR